jgi:glycosyltransferase involved in cell wall biosynthesis
MTDCDASFRISVLIPAFNAEAYIAEAVQSVLAQTLPPAEIVVFDDGSTDSSRGLLKGFGDKIRLLGPERLGFTGARNRLLAEARHEWIAFHDADDIWMPRKLEIQVAWLRANTDHEGCLALSEQFLEPGCTLPSGFRNALLGKPTAQLFIPNLLAHRSVFDRVGGFDMADPSGADSDWFVRARDAGVRLGVVEEILYRRRWHDTNLSYQFAFNRNMFDILRRSVQRKRGNG